METVVIDCNVLVMCLTSRSPYHDIYKCLLNGKYKLALSFEILLEYEEVIQKKYSVPTADAFISLLKELPNVYSFSPHYKWGLIDADPDDNKYCDCAIAAGAQYIVTEDKHFNVLSSIGFPKINTLSIKDFMEKLIS